MLVLLLLMLTLILLFGNIDACRQSVVFVVTQNLGPGPLYRVDYTFFHYITSYLSPGTPTISSTI